MPDEIGEALLRRVHEIWAQSCDPGAGLPTRATLDLPFSMPFALSHLALLDVVPTAEGRHRFRYRVVGDRVNWLFGKDPTGCCLDDALAGTFAGKLTAAFEQNVTEREPRYTVLRSPWRTNMHFAHYSAPIAGGEGVTQVLAVIESLNDSHLLTPYFLGYGQR